MLKFSHSLLSSGRGGPGMAASAPELGSSLTRVPHCSPLLVLALHTAPGTQRDSTHDSSGMEAADKAS